jgi:hypothetical protein
VPGVIPAGKAAGAWHWPPTPSSTEVKERVDLYLYSFPWPSWPVLGRSLPLASKYTEIEPTITSLSLCALCCQILSTIIQSLYCVCSELVSASLNKYIYCYSPNNHRSLRYHNSISISTAHSVFSTLYRPSLDPYRRPSYRFHGHFPRGKAVWARATPASNAEVGNECSHVRTSPPRKLHNLLYWWRNSRRFKPENALPVSSVQVPIGQENIVHTLIFQCLFYILPSTPMSSKWSLSLFFLKLKFCMHFSSPVLATWINPPDYIRWKVWILKFLVFFLLTVVFVSCCSEMY